MPSKLSKDRSSLCSFTFVDGRRCRTPRCTSHAYLCYFHARVEAQTLAAQQTGRNIASWISTGYLSACDLTAALGQLFRATVQGAVEPKTANTLAYIGQTIAQSMHLAQDEYINAFGEEEWCDTIRSRFDPPPDPEPAPVDVKPLTESATAPAGAHASKDHTQD